MVALSTTATAPTAAPAAEAAEEASVEAPRETSASCSSNAGTSSAPPPPPLLPSPSSSSSNEDDALVHFFGYGPIVNPLVRQRRGIQTHQAQAAVLVEHRLTFAFGGVVNIIPQRGYEVYGVLLSFATQDDWETFQGFDAGYNLDQVQVHLGTESPSSETITTASASTTSTTTTRTVQAYTFVMKDFDGEKVEGGRLEKLPQERYLKLIAAGLRSYHIDADYIEDCIMGVPYTPKTKPEDFKSFPTVSTPSSSHHRSHNSNNNTPALPKITFQRYQEQLCASAPLGRTYFIIQDRVIQLDPHDVENPCAVWIREKAHGQSDITLTLHQNIIDPDIPPVDTVAELTPLHYRWCENHFVEYLAQGDMTAMAVFQISNSAQDRSSSPNVTSWWQFCCPRTFGGRPNSTHPHPSSSVAMMPERISRRDHHHIHGEATDESPTQDISLRDLPRGMDGETDDEDLSMG